MKDLKTNYKKGVIVAKDLVGMLHKREYPFNREDLTSLFPDSIVPEGIKQGSREHALYLFSTCALDSGMLAEVVYAGMRSLVQTEDITQLYRLDITSLVKTLVPHFKSIGNPEEAITQPAETLHFNLKKLQEEYEGDPRLILGEDILSTMRNIKFGKTGSTKPSQKFKRYGDGTAALFIKNMTRFGCWNFSEYSIPVKIDRHMQRISLGTGVVEIIDITRGRVDSLVRVLTSLYHEVCENEKISAIELCDAKWAVGHFKCSKNSDIYCLTTCPVQCDTRPVLEANKGDKANSRPSYFVANSEMRKDKDNLFRYYLKK